MIVPMKKVSLIILTNEKTKILKRLRKLGLLHIEIAEGSGDWLAKLKEQISLLESAIFTVSEKVTKTTSKKEVSVTSAIEIAEKVKALTDEKKQCLTKISTISAEMERLKSWGEINPEELKNLALKGVDISLYEMPLKEYRNLDSTLKTLVISKTKASVKFGIVNSGEEGEEDLISSLSAYKLTLPQVSTSDMQRKVDGLRARLELIEQELTSYSEYLDG